MSIYRPFFLLAVVSLLFISCDTVFQKVEDEESRRLEDQQEIHNFIDDWHEDAANARPAYFDKMAEGSIYIGTDKTELWTKEEFREWSQKYFDHGKAWDFEAISRNIYFTEGGDYAWFDEMLDTWMGDCRASGVLKREDDSWSIKHYHLSVTVPNDTLEGFIDMVKAFEEKGMHSQDSL